jgi:uncharacterized protein (DUF58 family)
VQLHPTRPTFHIALSGAAMVALGSAARVAAIVAFGGAMILAVAIGRAFALVAVTRLRAAGFEMVWAGSKRVLRMARGGEVRVVAELRNRGVDEVRAVAVRPLASTMLGVSVEPTVIDLPAGGAVRVDVVVTGKRVGRWGLHGLALEVRGTPAGGEGLYEVPLLFANPFGIEVLPQALHTLITSPRGGRARRVSEIGRAANVAGQGDELRELREHVPGDAFKRIAWKASAKRGQLLVREMEREDRDILWIVLDASVELWAGAPGSAPLDAGVDELAGLAVRHLARGDDVGLVVLASRLRSWIDPEGGGAQGVRIAAALASAASAIDADRTELDEVDVGQRVAEHARPLDARSLADLPKGDLDALAARADVIRQRAPFAPRVPYAKTPREQSLRHYLAAFGVEVPPRADGEREKSEATLAHVLERLSALRPRASIVHVWAPGPSRASQAAKGIRLLRAHRCEVRWTTPRFDDSLAASRHTGVQAAVDAAVSIRALASKARGERILRKLGVKCVSLEPRSQRAAEEAPLAAPPREGAA